MGGLVPRYLDYSMRAFSRNEQQMRDYMLNALEGMFPFNPFEEMSKQNMSFIENAMKMFSPFYQAHGVDGTAEDAKVDTLQARLYTLQQQINQLNKKK